MLRAILYNRCIADSLFIFPMASEMRIKSNADVSDEKSSIPRRRNWTAICVGVVFLLLSIAGLLHYRKVQNAKTVTPLEEFINKSKDAAPVYSLSSLYDEDVIKHSNDHFLTELLEKHSKFLWVEMGVLLFAPQFSTAKLLSSPTVRMVLRQHSKSAVQNSRKFFSVAGKTIKTLYKHRDKYSTLSDYTWYVNVEEKDENKASKA
eukprot:scaffold11571_cov122-Cylindrotheca_fusiformis.AAC.3